jgi:hypothetical protein
MSLSPYLLYLAPTFVLCLTLQEPAHVSNSEMQKLAVDASGGIHIPAEQQLVKSAASQTDVPPHASADAYLDKSSSSWREQVVTEGSFISQACNQCRAEQGEVFGVQDLERCEAYIHHGSDVDGQLTLSSARRRGNSKRKKCLHPGLPADAATTALDFGAEKLKNVGQSRKNFCGCLAQWVKQCDDTGCIHRKACRCKGLCKAFKAEELFCDEVLNTVQERREEDEGEGEGESLGEHSEEWQEPRTLLAVRGAGNLSDGQSNDDLENSLTGKCTA